jgi:hypothetical protein
MIRAQTNIQTAVNRPLRGRLGSLILGELAKRQFYSRLKVLGLLTIGQCGPGHQRGQRLAKLTSGFLARACAGKPTPRVGFGPQRIIPALTNLLTAFGASGDERLGLHQSVLMAWAAITVAN